MREKIWEVLDDYIYIASSVDVYEKAAIKAVEKMFLKSGVNFTYNTMDIYDSSYHVASFAWVDYNRHLQIETFMYN